MKESLAPAIANRTDGATLKVNLSNAEINALGTQNSVLPQLAVTASATVQGLSGQPQLVPVLRNTGQTSVGSGPKSGFVPCTISPVGLCQVADPYFDGGIGTALGQMVRRNFPSQRAGAF